MNTFYIVEDTESLSASISCYALMFVPRVYSIQNVSSCKDCFPKPGDFVLLDQNGVDLDCFSPNGAMVITMSGDPSLNVDLKKPFKVKELKNIIQNKIKLLNKAA